MTSDRDDPVGEPSAADDASAPPDAPAPPDPPAAPDARAGTTTSAASGGPPPTASPPPPPGWYPQPDDDGLWRWWDGHGWTGYVHRTHRRPKLPAWLSLPVIICAVLVLPLVAVALVLEPVATLLPVPTFLMLLAVFVWFDRLEPEPWQERIHAVLWGATVAIAGAGIINSAVFFAFGEVAGAVVSAPITEEVLKGAGILYAVRRRKIDGVTDGVVYAGWIAAGFAAVENVDYFMVAAGDGELLGTVILRGVLAPFAHPLFTVWIGITVGRAVVRGRSPVLGALPGLLIAIVLHALWNGATFLIDTPLVPITVLVVLGFVVLFLGTAGVLIAARLRDRHRIAQLVPQVAARYGLTPAEVLAFSDWRRTLATRRALPRSQRRIFDARHAAISRLVALHRRPEPPDPVVEKQLIADLWQARATG